MSRRKFARTPNNPHGIGGPKPGEARNPTGIGGGAAFKPGNSAGVVLNGKSIDLQQLARVHTRAALAVEVSIMRDKTVSAATRLTAAESILNRGHGRPIQPHSNPDLSPIDWNAMQPNELLVAMRKLEKMLGETPAFPGHMPTPEEHSQHLSS